MPATSMQMLNAAQLTNITQFIQILSHLQCHICCYLVLLWYFELFSSNWNLEFSNMLQSLDSGSHAAVG